MSNYIQKQIEARRSKLATQKRDLAAAKSTVERITRDITITEAELGAYEDAAANSEDKSAGEHARAAVLAPHANGAAADSKATLASPVAHKAMDSLAPQWRDMYRRLRAKGVSTFTTDDVMQAFEDTGGAAATRKSIRGTLSQHVQRGVIARVSDGQFRFENNEPSAAAAAKGSNVTEGVSASSVESREGSNLFG